MNSPGKLALLAICAIGSCPWGAAHGSQVKTYATQNSGTQPSSAQESSEQPEHAREFNPMRAVHDVEVGKFYMKRGDLAGAIARFKDAILYKPHYAEARLLLGQAYEKNNNPRLATMYYKQYLDILPTTPESKKIRERIAALQEKIAKEDAASAAKNP